MKTNATRVGMKFTLEILAAVIFVTLSNTGETKTTATYQNQHPEVLPAQFSETVSLPVDSGPKEELAKGKFLIAAQKLKDPNFAQTVVLLIDYNPKGAMGVIINRPTEIKLSAVLPDIKDLQQRDDVVYSGGPVAETQVLLLVRSGSQPEDSVHIFKDVYVSGSHAVLQQLVDKANPTERFRIYAGYAGWAPGQLDGEVSRGDWHILQADVETIFDQKPSKIWPDLILRSSAKWVRVWSPDLQQLYSTNPGIDSYRLLQRWRKR